MFLISKIVRGRRLLHELEAAQAAQKAKNEKEGGTRDSTEKSTQSETYDTSSDNDNTLKLRRPSKNSGDITRIRSSKKSKSKNMSTVVVNVSKNDNSVKKPNNRQKLSIPQEVTLNKSKSRFSIKDKINVSKKRKNTTIGVVITNECGVEKKNGRSVDGGMENNNLALRRTSSMPSVCDDVTYFKVTHYNYDTKLNRLQKRSLRFTWHRLQTKNGGKRVENVFEEVFDRLIKIIPTIKDMFTTRAFLSVMSRNECSTLRDHARVTVKMIDVVIKNLDLEDSKRTDTGSACDPRRVGAAHAPFRPYGITGHYWEKFGEMIIDVVLTQEAVRDLPGAGQAWVVLAACLVDQLRAGFEQKCSYLAYGNNSQNNNTKEHHKCSIPSYYEQIECPTKSQNFNSQDNDNCSLSVESSSTNSYQNLSNCPGHFTTPNLGNRRKIFFRGMSDSTDEYDSLCNSSTRSARGHPTFGHTYSVDNRKLTLSDLQLSDIPSRNIVYNSIDPSKEIKRPMVRSPKGGNQTSKSSERVYDNKKGNNSNKSKMAEELYHPMQNCLLSNDI
ncbi:Globin family and Globin-like domain and Globin, structural domain-containing protein [Strongyloides ratti]|uniref:Globin family and Globin-like domain and Globin, structural domain-containing protein n=1 Tax=Strongyloides ratti TaxID=34506 RepID=A0A090L7T0_STRRB|nr:Globin family and Globin-like domain and Globin, structural domain-containing protein [Strongyloides ratti]CEF64173.1 Globin family and Globin-like domain and Globin, structural domain-containing protein [Strongyloides ratti]